LYSKSFTSPLDASTYLKKLSKATKTTVILSADLLIAESFKIESTPTPHKL